MAARPSGPAGAWRWCGIAARRRIRSAWATATPSSRRRPIRRSKRWDADVDAVERSGLFAATHVERFAHGQVMDRDGLIGRALSASYVPKEGPGVARLIELLGALHARHADASGHVTLVYETEVRLSSGAPAERSFRAERPLRAERPFWAERSFGIEEAAASSSCRWLLVLLLLLLLLLSFLVEDLSLLTCPWRLARGTCRPCWRACPPSSCCRPSCCRRQQRRPASSRRPSARRRSLP